MHHLRFPVAVQPEARVLELAADPSDSDGAHGPLPVLDGMPSTAVRILEAGLELFAARGYHATSIRDIAAGAGLQSASLYTHFPSKEAILTELVTLAHTVHHRALLSALIAASSDPKDQLSKLIQAHVAAHCRWSGLATVANRDLEHLSELAAAAALALRDSSRQLVVEVIERGLEQDIFVIDDLDITLSAVASLGIAVINWYPAKAAKYTPEQVGATYADLTLLMLGATK
jgi:AcrR family transcriptional regulator